MGRAYTPRVYVIFIYFLSSHWPQRLAVRSDSCRFTQDIVGPFTGKLTFIFDKQQLLKPGDCGAGMSIQAWRLQFAWNDCAGLREIICKGGKRKWAAFPGPQMRGTGAPNYWILVIPPIRKNANGWAPGCAVRYSRRMIAKAARAAAMVASMSASLCAVERNAASNCEGGSQIPCSSIAR